MRGRISLAVVAVAWAGCASPTVDDEAQGSGTDVGGGNVPGSSSSSPRTPVAGGTGSSGAATDTSTPASSATPADSQPAAATSTASDPAPSSSSAQPNPSSDSPPPPSSSAAPIPEVTLAADPASVDFGVLPSGGTLTRTVRIRNVGNTLARLGTVTGATSPAGGVTVSSALDGLVLGANGEAFLDIAWTQVATDQMGDVHIPVTNADGYELVIHLFGSMQRPGATCSCPSAVDAVPLQTLSLTATCTDPDGTIGSYRWAVETRPGGSTSNPTPEDQPATSFFLDLAGDYVLRFQGLPLRGDPVATCTVPIHVVPPQNLHIQLVWDTDSSDVDVHLLGPDGGAYFSSTEPGDCYYSNRTTSWGSASADDDATLDIDDVNGFGPENINVLSPAAGTYTLGVHYYCAHGASPPTRATLRVYCNGQLAREMQRDFSLSRQFWDVATIAWPACNVTEDPRPLRDVTQGCSP
ncbi:MAG: hypothetical protein HY904_01075 [Deltaproteobacteria bacterium]|nr:hypothetical protein [Deltaproteobacteria bacterium]